MATRVVAAPPGPARPPMTLFLPDPPPRPGAGGTTTRVSALTYRFAGGLLHAVRVTAELAVLRVGRRELVRGRVWGSASGPAARVEALRVGGALVRRATCADVLRFGAIVASGDTIVARERGATYDRLGPRFGDDLCWVQAGHAYFTLRLASGEAWTSFVTTDARADLTAPLDTRLLHPPT